MFQNASKMLQNVPKMLQNSLQCFKMPQKLFKMLQRFLRHFLNCFRKMPQKWFKMPQNASKFFTMLQKMPLKCLQRSLRHFLNCFRKCDKDKKSIAIGEAFEFQENCEIQDLSTPEAFLVSSQFFTMLQNASKMIQKHTF